jgi:hypothetical protein
MAYDMICFSTVFGQASIRVTLPIHDQRAEKVVACRRSDFIDFQGTKVRLNEALDDAFVLVPRLPADSAAKGRCDHISVGVDDYWRDLDAREPFGRHILERRVRRQFRITLLAFFQGSQQGGLGLAFGGAEFAVRPCHAVMTPVPATGPPLP